MVPILFFFVLPAETHIQAQYKARMGIQGLGVSIRTTPRGWVPRAKLITVISSHCMHRFHRPWRSDRAVPRRQEVKRKQLLPARLSAVVAGTSVAAGGCFASPRRPSQIDVLGKARHRLGIFPARV